MKIYNKNNLQLKSLLERTNGFVINKGKIHLKEDISSPSSQDGTGNITSSDIAKASQGEDQGDTVRVGGDSIDGNPSDNRATISASGCKTNPNDPKSQLSQSKVTNKINSLKHDPNVQKLGGLKNVNIDFNSVTPRKVMENIETLRNNSVSYSKNELNQILLKK